MAVSPSPWPTPRRIQSSSLQKRSFNGFLDRDGDTSSVSGLTVNTVDAATFVVTPPAVIPSGPMPTGVAPSSLTTSPTALTRQVPLHPSKFWKLTMLHSCREILKMYFQSWSALKKQFLALQGDEYKNDKAAVITAVNIVTGR